MTGAKLAPQVGEQVYISLLVNLNAESGRPKHFYHNRSFYSCKDTG